MALTDDVKEELARVRVTRPQTKAAEVATLLRFAGGLHVISNRVAVESELDSAAAAARLARSILELYGVKAEIARISSSSSRSSGAYLVRVIAEGETLARQTGLMDARRKPVRGLPNKVTTGSLEDLAGVWRAAFLAQGALSDPGRSAALEIACPGNEAAMALVGAAGRLGVPAKSREVRGAHRVVIREGEPISRMLTTMGALDTVRAWAELRQRREVRATANRLVNFDDANLRRSAQAAVAASARIERALEILGVDVPEHLAYAGRLRLEHRDASLDELGHLAKPTMTKDAVAGRIRRLLAMADRAAQDRGIPSTESAVPDDIDL
ncbi:DNA-binding protein WhiA [Agrococcus beijingensis]|uniref:DNA-binding protein WhiA n=1 Tax=Agrococcus beijingensis TaxID=3068634 RepID=UPI0027410B25|nr:DNA-binding protein WhiA [Agrococcus sp. REN33]